MSNEDWRLAAINEVRSWNERLAADFRAAEEKKRQEELNDLQEEFDSIDDQEKIHRQKISKLLRDKEKESSDEVINAKIQGSYFTFGDNYLYALFGYLIGMTNQEAHSLPLPVKNTVSYQAFYGLILSSQFTFDATTRCKMALQGPITAMLCKALLSIATVPLKYNISQFEYLSGLLLHNVISIIKKADHELSDNAKTCSKEFIQSLINNKEMLWHSPEDDAVFIIRDILPWIERGVNAQDGILREKQIARVNENLKPFFNKLKHIAGNPSRTELCICLENYSKIGKYGEMRLSIDKYLALTAPVYEDTDAPTEPPLPEAPPSPQPQPSEKSEVEQDASPKHPSGFCSPSSKLKIGDAAERLGIGRGESAVRKLRNHIARHSPNLATQVPDEKGYYWFNREFLSEYKKLPADNPTVID